MNAVTGFVAIVSLLLALSAGGGTPTPQAGTTRKAGEGQKDWSLITPSKLATNHNETLVVDTVPMNWKEKRS